MALAKQIQDNGKTGSKYIVYENWGAAHPVEARSILGRYKTFKQAKEAHPEAADWTRKGLKKIFQKGGGNGNG